MKKHSKIINNTSEVSTNDPVANNEVSKVGLENEKLLEDIY